MSSCSSSSRLLWKALQSPSRVANTLDWRKARGSSILAMEIGHERIGVAVAFHPSTEIPIRAIPPIALHKEDHRKQKSNASRSPPACSLLQDVQRLVVQYDVCAFVVSWPLQKEGRAGAPCGKVLYTLESLLQQSQLQARSNKLLLSSARPFCLWKNIMARQPDDARIPPAMQDDEWGRNPLYSKPTNKKIHFASIEQYALRNTTTAATLYQQQQQQQQSNNNRFVESESAAQLCFDFQRNYWPAHQHHLILSLQEEQDLSWQHLSKATAVAAPPTIVATAVAGH